MEQERFLKFKLGTRNATQFTWPHCLQKEVPTYNCPARRCRSTRLCRSPHTQPPRFPRASSRLTQALTARRPRPHQQEACHYFPDRLRRENPIPRGRSRQTGPHTWTLRLPLPRQSSNHFPALAPPACHTRARHSPAPRPSTSI